MKKNALLSKKLQLKKVVVTKLSNTIKGGAALVMNPDESIDDNYSCCCSNGDSGFLSLAAC